VQSSVQPKSLNSEYAEQAIIYLKSATYEQALAVYAQILDDPCCDDSVVAQVAAADRFFLVAQILRRSDAYHPWLFERCREVEATPDDHLDLWARGHYKSTFITFGGSFQEIIRNPEITIGIFSHTRGIAKTFLSQIKEECEQNPDLPRLWPHIFWRDPRRQAPSWSLDFGLVMKRKTNPKEKTVESWGLVDGQPISKHFGLIIYNDVVTEESVGSPEMILKTTRAWELSRNLIVTEREDVLPPRTWHEGTRYNYADTYGVILKRGAIAPRIYPATDNGLPDGKPVFLTEKAWAKKKKESSPHTIACQQLLNPLAGSQQEFKPDWIRRWEVRPETMNVAILVDPANSKKRGTSNSAFAVIGVDAAWNKYLLDGACHKMGLKERWEMLKYLRQKWIRQPGVQVVIVGYERYGMQCDIDYHKEMMILEKCPFPITEVSWTQERSEQSKDDRIRRLIPDHQNWRFFYPYEGQDTKLMMAADELKKSHLKASAITRKDQDGKLYNLVNWMIDNEYNFFPATTSKDFLDAMSRLYDLNMNPPQKVREEHVTPPYTGDF
jgi:hypothetical protein